jgi:hypothetical protein
VFNEFGRMWDELFMAQYELLSVHLSGGNEENYENLLGWPVFIQNLKLEIPIYKARLLNTH